MNMKMRRNNLVTANQNSKIADLLDKLTEQELELVVGGTDNWTTSNISKICLEDKLGITQNCWTSSGGGNTGGSGGGGTGGTGGW